MVSGRSVGQWCVSTTTSWPLEGWEGGGMSFLSKELLDANDGVE